MSYLITGADGFLGKSLQKISKIKSKKIQTLGLSNKNDIVCNLKEQIPRIPNNIKVIIHAAGKAHTYPKSDLEKKEFYDVNYTGTINLINAIEKYELKINQFIFISTVAVYGKKNKEDINEDCNLNGKSAYSKSKIKAEKYILEWGAKNNINILILRLPLLVGKNPPGNLGKMIHSIKNGYYIKINTPNIKKSMVLVDDVSNLIFNIKQSNGVYNLTDGVHPKISQVEEVICNFYNKRIRFKFPFIFIKIFCWFGDRINSRTINSSIVEKLTSSLTFDDSRARKDLLWKPRPVIHNFFK